MGGSIHRFVVDQLNARKGQWPDVAAESGVSLRTIEKIARREVENPRIRTIEPLLDYFQRKGRRRRVA